MGKISFLNVQNGYTESKFTMARNREIEKDLENDKRSSNFSIQHEKA